MKVVTKYVGPTDEMGAVITATNEAGNRKAVVPYAYELDRRGRHMEAISVLAAQVGLLAPYSVQVLEDNATGYVVEVSEGDGEIHRAATPEAHGLLPDSSAKLAALMVAELKAALSVSVRVPMLDACD